MNEIPIPKNNNQLYVVKYDYRAAHDDELSLQRGSHVRVLSKDQRISGDEGWWTGVVSSASSSTTSPNAKKGIFPYNYVEPIGQASVTKLPEFDNSLHHFLKHILL